MRPLSAHAGRARAGDDDYQPLSCLIHHPWVLRIRFTVPLDLKFLPLVGILRRLPRLSLVICRDRDFVPIPIGTCKLRRAVKNTLATAAVPVVG